MAGRNAFFIVFNCVNPCASMHLLVEIHNSQKNNKKNSNVKCLCESKGKYLAPEKKSGLKGQLVDSLIHHITCVFALCSSVKNKFNTSLLASLAGDYNRKISH